MSKAQEHTIYFEPLNSLSRFQWVRFAPLGFPFVTDCLVEDVDAVRRIWKAIDVIVSGDEKEVFGKTYDVRIRGTVWKHHYTKEERAKWNVSMKDTLGGYRAPAWDWEVTCDDIISVTELHWAKQLWLSLPSVAVCIGFLIWMVCGIGSCIRNW